MVPFLLQDWLTLQGPSVASPAPPITQSEFAWLDTSAFLDLVTWLEVAEISAGNYFCAFQTSPTKDEAFFTAMNDVTLTTNKMVLGVQVGVYLRDTALCPLSHWLRWQIIPPASTIWNMTFRIWVSANQPGGFAGDLNNAAGAQFGGPAWTESTGTAPGGSPAAPWKASSLLRGGNLSNLRAPQAPRPLGALGQPSHQRLYSPPPLGADSGARMRAPRGVGQQRRNIEVASPGSAFNRFLPPGTTVEKK